MITDDLSKRNVLLLHQPSLEQGIETGSRSLVLDILISDFCVRAEQLSGVLSDFVEDVRVEAAHGSVPQELKEERLQEVSPEVAFAEDIDIE